MGGPRRKVLFFARDPHNVVVYERVLRRLLADPRIELSLTSKHRRRKPANSVFDSFDLPGAARVHCGLAQFRKYDLYLSPDVYLLAGRSRVKVHTFHGISIKGKAYTGKVKAYDALFLIGPYMRDRFAELGVLARDDPRFREIGMPKTDAFFDGSLERRSFLEARGLDPARPTVLYAPTWRKESSLFSLGEDFIRAMRGAPMNLLVKLHDLVYSEPGPVDWRAKLRELAAPNVSIVGDLDVTPSLFAADLLVSDASSVANEFTLLDRPIVFADVPRLLAKYGDSVDRSRWGQRAGPVAATAAEIMRAIEQSLSDPAAYGDVRRQIAREGFYNPGRAADAALAEIARLIELDAAAPPD